MNLYIGKEKIATLKSYNIDLPKPTVFMEYYMKRGNKMYFRSSFGKMIVESSTKYEGLKYGDKVNIEYELQPPNQDTNQKK